jgi:hypothetical protein
MGLIRRSGEFHDGCAVYEITEFGHRVSSDVLGDQAMDKPQGACCMGTARWSRLGGRSTGRSLPDSTAPTCDAPHLERQAL